MAVRQFANLSFNPDDGQLSTVSGNSVHLRPKAARLLDCLLDHAGEVVSRERLVEAVWDDTTVVDFESGLAALLRELRQAIQSLDGPAELVETLPRRGYRLNTVVECSYRPPPIRHPWRGRWLAVLIGVVLLVAAGAYGLLRQPDGTAPDSRQCSVAIMPFKLYQAPPGLSDNGDLLLADRLLGILLREPIEGMSLLGRTSLQPYLERSDVAAAVAEDLGVDSLIEGAVQSAGEGQWRIAARLLELPAGRVLWSEDVTIKPEQGFDMDAAMKALADSLADVWPRICARRR